MEKERGAMWPHRVSKWPPTAMVQCSMLNVERSLFAPWLARRI
jgi:hypothetical protein